MGQHRRPSASAERVVKRQSAFREVNDRIQELCDLLDVVGSETRPLRILCECGQSRCEDTLELTPSEYEALRRSPTRFAVAPGHDLPVVERVVAANERFATVEKIGPGGHTAAALDPRGGTAELRAG